MFAIVILGTFGVLLGTLGVRRFAASAPGEGVALALSALVVLGAAAATWASAGA